MPTSHASLAGTDGLAVLTGVALSAAPQARGQRPDRQARRPNRPHRPGFSSLRIRAVTDDSRRLDGDAV